MTIGPTDLRAAGAGEPEILVLPDGEAASAAAAGRIAAALTAAVAARGVAHWATTGGSTPGPIYRVLAGAQMRDAVPWERVHLWWSDDRWAPPDGSLSNARDAHELLLPYVPIRADRVHAIPIGEAMNGGHPAAWAAARYEESLRAAAMPLDGAGFPVLDLALVGIGGDGHLFSVFPGSATWDDPAWAQAVPAPTHIEPHVERVTLHPEILRAARLPIAVAHGAGKAGIIARIFGPRVDAGQLPAQLARRPGALWVLDEAAAVVLPPHVATTRPG
ncbi:MAG TPA: 6-phosphogluconolactonase [Candidatus Limnocylindrales bacterium]|nr:6-phosphogluconolactonase [Candidatus Limnocylindrales bacterium]